MGFPKVDVQLQSGGLGKVDDLGGGKGALLVQCAAVTGHAYGEVVTYGAYDELPAELAAIDGVQRYFDLGEGINVAIMPMPTSATVKDAVNGMHGTPYLKNLLEQDTDVRFVGVIGAMGAADLQAACTTAQALANIRAAEYAPVAVMLPYNYGSDDTVLDLASASYNRVGVCVSSAGEEIGLLIGRLASTPVQRNVGRVKDGSMPIVDPLVDGVALERQITTIEELHNKGYITLRTHVGRVGYYFTDDPLATMPTGDYSTIANRRVIDKAMVITYDTYLNELLDEVEITDGKINAGVVKYLQGTIETAIGNQMTTEGEISSVEAYIDESQNILSTGKLEIILKIVPVGCLKAIIVKLGFSAE